MKMITIYHLEVTAVNKCYDMEDVSHHYISADSYEEAKDYVVNMLKKGDWEIKKITNHTINLLDIRKDAQ